jgi:hypothetical protein
MRSAATIFVICGAVRFSKDLIALNFLTVPTVTFRVLLVLVMLTHSRRRLVHFNVAAHPTAEWTAPTARGM